MCLKLFPAFEEEAYNYVRELYLYKAPATRANRFREAVAFMKGVMGLDEAEDILQSRRIAGAALKSLMTKRPQVQRDPLTTLWLTIFERVAMSGTDDIEAVFCGMVCFTCLVRGPLV